MITILICICIMNLIASGLLAWYFFNYLDKAHTRIDEMESMVLKHNKFMMLNGVSAQPVSIKFERE